MCRRPIHFSGFHKVRESWDEEAWETKCADVYGAALDRVFEEACEFAESFGPKWRRRIFREVIEDFKDMDKTLRALKAYSAPIDVIEDAFYWDEYYSDRHLDKCEWNDEPAREVVPSKAVGFGRTRGGKRCRALEDEWCTLNFVIEI
jgi:hypothetical protein